VKRTPLKRRAPIKRSTAKASRQPRRTSPGFTEETKAWVRRRSGNRCEVRAGEHCTGRAAHFHHRKLRRHGDHGAANCLHVCLECHVHLHANPAKAELMGWIVRSHLDPAAVPVRYGDA
jgi:hypothetical protein